jgi:hippurate hydrolase
MEFRTSGIIAKNLKSLGYKVISNIAKTGVVGIMKNGEGPTVMYRADMDCNAVKETTGVSYASTKTVKKDDGTETPVMHACGHDAHVTWLLGIAKYMAKNKNSWKGTLILVGQPAEELILGAEAMVNDGMYKKGVPEPDFLFGMHTFPNRLGIIMAKGLRLAGTDQIDVTFKGIGGHGSQPQATKDPVVMAANAVMQYQTIVSRMTDPQSPTVLTVGSIQAGSDNNVIPDNSLLKVNLRWLDEKERNVMIDGIQNINNGIAQANNLPKELYPTIKKKSWAYPLTNDDELTDTVVKGIQKIIPEKDILKEDVLKKPLMGSEDFHHLVIHNTKSKKYCFIFVGTAAPKLVDEALKEGKQVPFRNHNGNYLVDLAAIPQGTKIGIVSLLEIFNKN